MSSIRTYTRLGRSGRRERAQVLITLATVLLGLVLAGCDDNLGLVCTTEAVYGINLNVRDDVGAPAAQGALGVAIEGTFADTMDVFSDVDMAGAIERAGTYDITVSKPGFSDWTRTNVVVTADECHVIPVQFDVTLTPTS